MNTIQSAVNFAIAIAKDESHGYDQIDRWGHPNYDCSGLVITAYEQAGVPVKKNGASYTGNMRKAFLKSGFVDVVKTIDQKTGKGLQVGDVLLKEGSHTALYIGDGKIVHASINEKGKVTGGQSGDQTGKEICVRSYYCKPWNSILRYTQGQTASTIKSDGKPVVVTAYHLNVRSKAGISGAVVAIVHKEQILTIYETKKVGTSVWGRCEIGWVNLKFTKEAA